MRVSSWQCLAGLYGRERSELGYLAVIRIDLPSAQKVRFLNGYY